MLLMENEKNKTISALHRYRPALAAFGLMMSMALTTTGLSFFVEPVCRELGLSRGAFTVYYSLMTAAGTLASPFLGQIIRRRGVRPVAAISAVWTAAGLFGLSLCRRLWCFYLLGIWTGIFGTACVTLCAGILVQTCYRGSEASRLTGIVMAGSGLGGVLVSMALPKVIGSLGWQTGYRVTALGWLVLVSVSAWLLHGCDETAGSASAAVKGKRKTALHSLTLYRLILMIFLLSAASGVQQQLPSVLADAGLAPSRIGTAMSVFTGALALGKIAQGMLYAKAGPARGGVVMVLCYLAGFVLLGIRQPWPGLLMLAAGMGTVTTLMPIVTRSAFPGQEYAAVWSILSAVSNLGALTAAPLFGMAFDMTGSYAGAMLAASVLLTPALAASIRNPGPR